MSKSKKLIGKAAIIQAAIEAMRLIEFGEECNIGSVTVNTKDTFVVSGFTIIVGLDLRKGKRSEYHKFALLSKTRWTLFINDRTTRAKACSKLGRLMTGLEHSHKYTDEAYGINELVRQLNDELKK